MNIDKKIDRYFELCKEIHDFFGYQEDWQTIPLEDMRDQYWFVTGDGSGDYGSSKYCHSPDPFTKDSIEEEMTIFCGPIYTYCHLKQWVYRTETHTLVCADTQCDGNKYLMIFDNEWECKDQALIDLFKESW